MNIKGTIVPFQQGTEEWAQHRARSLNASELAAAMGLSPYLSRADLIKQKATCIVPEVDAATQRRFDKGHEVEAAARPLAEEFIGEELYCSVFAAEVDGMLLSASLDGHTLLNEVTWEHKQANAELIASLRAGVIPEQYHPQMEQGLMLAGAERCLFTASNGTRESAVHVWYESNPELRAKIIPTWKQFMADVAAYVPAAAEAPKPTGKAPEYLPALRIEVTGAVTASNLSEFKAQALAVFQGINRDLKTDDDFANAEATVKWAKGIEDRLAAAKESALAQTESIDALFRTIDDISAEARSVRLDLDKLVKARKEAIKSEIVAGGVAALAKHIREMNAAMPKDFMPTVPADFGGAIKGLRTVDSIRNAVDTELARAKIAASEIANRIHANIGRLDAANAPMLFAYDMQALVLKQPDDLAAVIAQRLAAEHQRKEAERERILAEERAREAQQIAHNRAQAEMLDRQKQRDLADQANAVVNKVVATMGLSDESHRVSGVEPVADQDTGARLTLGQINERIAPLSISVGGLSTLGFEPVAVVKAARMYRECDFGAICRAISEHVLAAAEQIAEAA